MNELPTSQSEQMMPYIKQKKKHGAARIIALAATVVIIAAIAVTLSRGDGGNFFGKLFGGAATAESSSTEQTSETTKSIYDYDLSSVPAGEHAIIPADLSAINQNAAFIGGENVSTETAELSPIKDGKVHVLLINTHPYESYQPTAAASYGDGFSATGEEYSVKRIAEAAVIKLVSLGIGAEYLDTGVTSGMGSYSVARKKVTDYLSAHPEIMYVIDIHRGVTTDSSQNLLRPIAEKNGTVYAQMGFSVGKTSGKYDETLAVTNAFVREMTADFPYLLMPTEIASSSLNQDIPATVLTVDIGTCANSYGEAENTAKYLAATMARLLLK